MLRETRIKPLSVTIHATTHSSTPYPRFNEIRFLPFSYTPTHLHTYTPTHLCTYTPTHLVANLTLLEHIFHSHAAPFFFRWFFSRRKILSNIRATRTSIQHGMIHARPLAPDLLWGLFPDITLTLTLTLSQPQPQP